jgi:hypothetical protein
LRSSSAWWWYLSMAGLCDMSMLRQGPCGQLRMTRGPCVSLLLHRDGLPGPKSHGREQGVASDIGQRHPHAARTGDLSHRADRPTERSTCPKHGPSMARLPIFWTAPQWHPDRRGLGRRVPACNHAAPGRVEAAAQVKARRSVATPDPGVLRRREWRVAARYQRRTKKIASWRTTTTDWGETNGTDVKVGNVGATSRLRDEEPRSRVASALGTWQGPSETRRQLATSLTMRRITRSGMVRRPLQCSCVGKLANSGLIAGRAFPAIPKTATACSFGPSCPQSVSPQALVS